MCGKVEKKSRKISPGSSIFFTTEEHTIMGTWGVNNGSLYNARSEKRETTWKKFNKCIVEVDAFYEGGKKFTSSSGKFYLAGLYNAKEEVVLLTQPANDAVKPYHHRMPVIITNIKEYFNETVY
jgi:putative SOS response-associated peptidase YedK